MSVSQPSATPSVAKTRERVHRGRVYRISEAHPVAEFYQWMPEDEIDSLAANIREHGQEKAIRRLPDGQIIDGRNRELACLVAGVEPRYEECNLTTIAEIISHIRAANEFRRHSTESQRAMTAARLANLKRGSNQYGAKLDGAQAPSISQGAVAEQFHISRDLVKRATSVLRSEVTELAAVVDAGRLDVTTAARVAGLPTPAQRDVIGAPDPKAAAQLAFFKYPRTPCEDEQDPVPLGAGYIKITPDTPTDGSFRGPDGVEHPGIPEPLADGRVWVGLHLDPPDEEVGARLAYLIPSTSGRWHVLIAECKADSWSTTKFAATPSSARLILTHPTLFGFDIYTATWRPSDDFQPSEINPLFLDPERASELSEDVQEVVEWEQRRLARMSEEGTTATH